jgi:hypothetical protein
LSEPSVVENATRGLDHLYDLEFEAAQTEFAKIDRDHPDHPIGPFLQSLTLWWEILLDLTDTSHDDAFYDAMDEVIARSDRLMKEDKDDVDGMFFKGAALGFRGRLRSNRGDWFKAAMDGKRAMDYVLGVPERDPANHDYAFGKGLYDYFAEVVPDKYPFTKPVMVFFPKGDRERGLEAIERTAYQGHYIRTEAVYFLLQINYLYERDYDKCVEFATWLTRRYPNNSYFQAIEGRVYATWGRWSQADAVFQDVLERYKSRRVGYNDSVGEQALYYLARGRMFRRDHEAALAYLMQLEALAARTKDETYFKVLGRLRQGMAHDAMGRRNIAMQRYREVLEMKDYSSAHERAEQYLRTPYRG